MDIFLYCAKSSCLIKNLSPAYFMWASVIFVVICFNIACVCMHIVSWRLSNFLFSHLWNTLLPWLFFNTPVSMQICKYANVNTNFAAFIVARWNIWWFDVCMPLYTNNPYVPQFFYPSCRDIKGIQEKIQSGKDCSLNVALVCWNNLTFQIYCKT